MYSPSLLQATREDNEDVIIAARW